jgi:RND family efflux transporter MFP subunit
VQSLHSFLIKPAGDATACVGVLLFEMAGDKSLSPERIEYIEQLLAHVAPVFSLKITAEASALSRVQSAVNQLKQKYVSRYKYGNKLLTAFGVLALLSLFVPVPYQVTSDARLQGAYKNLLVSPQEGFLGEITSRPGDLVKKGQVLAKLADEDLQLEHQKIASQLQQYQQEYDNALANGNRVQAAIANAQIDQASAQLQLNEQQMLRTQLIAPNDGVIVSDDISQNLGAPVKQGQVLFEIAAAKGYLVQLYVDERDIANIQLNQTGTVKLASLPNEPLHFSVVTITPISQVKDGRNYFRVEGRLVNESAILRPGMTGTGKITAGYHALGWVWFHDVWHWLMLKFWW